MKRDAVVRLLRDKFEANYPMDMPQTMDLSEMADSSLEVLEDLELIEVSRKDGAVTPGQRRPVNVTFLKRTIQNEYNIQNEDRPLAGSEVAEMVLNILHELGAVTLPKTAETATTEPARVN